MPRTKKKPEPEPPGPAVCKPLGELPLYQVPGVPPHVVNRLALLKPDPVRTLADLEKRAKPYTVNRPVWSALTECGITGGDRLAASKAIEAHLNVNPMGAGGADRSGDPGGVAEAGVGGDRPVVATRADGDGLCGSSAQVGARGVAGDDGDTRSAPAATLAGHKPGCPIGARIAKAAAGVDDFTDSDPPPRRRPQGDPLPARSIELPRGEPVEEKFREWDRAGRVPAGAILTRFEGTGLDAKKSGHVLLCDGPLGKAGTMPSARAMEGYAVKHLVNVNGRPYSEAAYVWVPVGDNR